MDAENIVPVNARGKNVAVLKPAIALELLNDPSSSNPTSDLAAFRQEWIHEIQAQATRPALGNITNAQNQRQKPKGLRERNDQKTAIVKPTESASTKAEPKEDECMEIDILEDVEAEYASEEQASFDLTPLEIVYREPEYCADSMSYWRKTEVTFQANPRYMKRQPQIDSEMRSTLVDWMVEVGEEFKLKNETLALSIAYTDRFLSVMSCSRDKLQLAGVTAMFIASKYEEIYPPQALEFVNLTDNTYNTKQLIKLERSMLKALKFRCSQPTSLSFLMHLLKEYDALFRSSDPENMMTLENLSQYLLELTLMQTEFLCFSQSKVAAACLYVAAVTLNEDAWVRSIPQKTGFTMEQLEAPIRYTYKLFCLAKAGRLTYKAVIEKYSEDRFGEVSEVIDPPKEMPINLN